MNKKLVFIELTLIEQQTSVAINVRHIVSVRPKPVGCLIKLHGEDHETAVTQSYKDVMTRLVNQCHSSCFTS